MDVASQLSGHIVNGDSLQVYKELSIGTAKPSKEDQKKVPHHLIDILESPSVYTAGQFRKDVFSVLEKLKEGVAPLVVGGSGFYLKALQTGLYEIPPIPENVARSFEESSHPLEELYKKLQKVDPESAKKIDAHDSYRIQRALMIFQAHGKTLTEFQSEFQPLEFPWKKSKVILHMDKKILREKVILRTEKMLAQGLVEEVEHLLQSGVSKNWHPLSSIGYVECVEYLKGDSLANQEELLELIVRNTMGLVKRQMTWFKKESDAKWFDMSTQAKEARDFILEASR